LDVLNERLGSWIQRVPTDCLGEMRPFSLTDLPLMIAFSPRVYAETNRRLRAFQRNLTHRHWAGLHDVYPRAHIWGYAYLLFFWASYCDVLPQVLDDPDRSVVAENFMRYICEIDRFIDRAETRSFWHSRPRRLVRLPQIEPVMQELLQRLGQTSPTPQAYRSVARVVADFRRSAFRELTREDAEAPGAHIAVRRHKEATAGNLFRTWGLILARLYPVEEQVAQQAAEVVFSTGMAIQVLDDLSDAAVDYREGTINLFVSIAQQRPDDWALLRPYLEQCDGPYVSWPWVRTNLPVSYQAAMALRDHYLGRVSAVKRLARSRRASELLDEIVRIIGRF
jgi:hypothetical protein